jgi:hypothetical protein
MSAHALWLPLLLKTAVTAAFVIVATKTAERAGALIAALIVTLPIAAGPAYIFLTLEHGDDFIARSALLSFAVNSATYTFSIAYVLLAQRAGTTCPCAPGWCRCW